MGQNKANFPLKKFVGKDRNIFDLQSWSRTSCVFQSSSFDLEENHVVLSWKWLKKETFLKIDLFTVAVFFRFLFLSSPFHTICKMNGTYFEFHLLQMHYA